MPYLCMLLVYPNMSPLIQTPAVEKQGISELNEHSCQCKTAEADYPILNDESCLTDVDLDSPVCCGVSELTMTAEEDAYTAHAEYPCFKCVELRQLVIGLHEQIAQLKLDVMNSKTVIEPQTTPTCKLREELRGQIERLERTALESENIVTHCNLMNVKNHHPVDR